MLPSNRNFTNLVGKIAVSSVQVRILSTIGTSLRLSNPNCRWMDVWMYGLMDPEYAINRNPTVDIARGEDSNGIFGFTKKYPLEAVVRDSPIMSHLRIIIPCLLFLLCMC